MFPERAITSITNLVVTSSLRAMPDAGHADGVWRTVIEAVLADPDGQDVRRSQGLWALAVRSEISDDDVRCGGDVFGPALTPEGFVAMRCWAVVQAEHPARVRDACDAAWHRFTRVDDYGVETEPDAHAEDPEPFGYPVAEGASVILAFDARQDEAPHPHRALTCLRILVEELHRHGCTPARLVNPLHLPDDEGIDVEALADQIEESGGSNQSGAAPQRAGCTGGRPSWLPPFYEVARARAGYPSGPVPFVLLAGGQAMAWDPHRGLMRLPRAETEASARTVSMDLESLSADGTHLHYKRSVESATDLLRRGVLDICSGEVSLGPGPTEPVEVYDAEPGGAQLRFYWPARDAAPEDKRYRFELLEDSGVRELPLHDRLMPSSRPAAQFSPTGRLLLTSHVGPGSRWYVVCTDASTGQGREYDNACLLGTASWSPDGTRVLIERGNAPYVLELASGHDQPVADYPLSPDEPTSPDRWDALGWLGNDGLLMSLRHGRRIQLAYQPLDNSTRDPVLDIPVTASRTDTHGIALAPAVLRAAPHLIGYHPR